MIQSFIYRILPKVNQIIYTLDTIYDSNIMTLAQAVLDIIRSQASVGLLQVKRKREIIQSWIYGILLIKVNQVIYDLDTICDPNTMTLA